MERGKVEFLILLSFVFSRSMVYSAAQNGSENQLEVNLRLGAFRSFAGSYVVSRTVIVSNSRPSQI